MKINEILDTTVDYDKTFLKRIKNNCQPFLNESLYLPLYRGISNITNEKYIHKKTRENRRPKDTSVDITNFINNYFEKKFGIRFRSNHSMMAAGSYEFARTFGKPFNVFPAGEYKFCWSPKIADLFSWIITSIPIVDEDEDIFFDVFNEGNFEKATKMLDKLEYKTTDLKEAIKSKKEIMFYCKDYYGINFNFTMAEYRGNINTVANKIKFLINTI
jgi:hypothetical protein